MAEKKMTLAEKLKTCRENCGLTQNQVADALPITRSAYTSYEIGRAMPSYATLQKIAKIFKVPLIDLLPEEESLDTRASDVELSARIKPIYQLSRDEQNLLIYYRVLTAEGQEDLKKKLRELVRDDTKHKNPEE